MKIKFPVLKKTGKIGDANVYSKTESLLSVEEMVKAYPLDVYFQSKQVVVVEKKSELLQLALNTIKNKASSLRDIDKAAKKVFVEDIDKTIDNENLQEVVKDNIEKINLEELDEIVVVGKHVLKEVDTDDGERYVFPWNADYDYVPKMRIMRKPFFKVSWTAGFNVIDGMCSMAVFYLVPTGHPPNSQQMVAVIKEKERDDYIVKDVGQDPCHYDNKTFDVVKISGYFEYFVSSPQSQGYTIKSPKFNYKQDYVDLVNTFGKAKKSYTIKQLINEITEYVENNVELNLPPMVKVFTPVKIEEECLEGVRAIKAEMEMTEFYYDGNGQANINLDRSSFPRTAYLVKPFKFDDSPTSS